MENYIARQPIYSSDKTLFGFELLYRYDSQNACPPGIDGDAATRKVISNSLFTFDLDALTKGRPAFINFTRRLLLTEVPNLLNPEQFAIEILEDVPLDRPLLYILQKYKNAGFTLVLDDYTGTHIPYEFLPLLDIIKVDFRATDRHIQEAVVGRVKPWPIRFLAEKVESEEDFKSACSSGYSLFQGYYFSKPVVFGKNALSISSFSHVKLMKEISRHDIDFKSIADIIYLDAELTLCLMKKMKSSEYYRGHTVSSINLALVRMGTNEVRRWVMLLLLQDIVGPEMDGLIRAGLIRAVFSECLSASLPLDMQRAAFCSGLFSVIAAKDDSVYTSLQQAGMGSILIDALKEENELGHCLSLICAYESADWTLVPFLLKQYFPNLDSHDLNTMYMAAVNYADSALTAP